MLRLARLAVDQSAHGQGIGAALLRFVLQLAVRMASDCGCVGVVVDAKPGAAASYARYGFKTVEATEGESGIRPRATPMFLSTRAIERALGST